MGFVNLDEVEFRHDVKHICHALNCAKCNSFPERRLLIAHKQVGWNPFGQLIPEGLVELPDYLLLVEHDEDPMVGQDSISKQIRDGFGHDNGLAETGRHHYLSAASICKRGPQPV